MRIKKINHYKYCCIFFLIIFIISCSTAENDWEKATRENTIDSYQAFINKHPNHKYSVNGKEKITELRNWEKALIESIKYLVTTDIQQEFAGIGFTSSK